VNRPHPILKVAAVASSALLLAGFVSYRAGAFDWTSPPADSPPAPEVAPSPEAAPVAGQLTPQAILSSSKSGAIVTPQTLPPSGAAQGVSSTTVKPSPAFLGSSKSLAPLIPPGETPKSDPAMPPK
jgi:hypothetical protein